MLDDPRHPLSSDLACLAMVRHLRRLRVMIRIGRKVRSRGNGRASVHGKYNAGHPVSEPDQQGYTLERIIQLTIELHLQPRT